MGRTIEVAAAAARNSGDLVMPVEYARSMVVENPAGVFAEKVLSMMIGHAGGAMGSDRWHVLDSGLMREYAGEGLSHLSVSVLRNMAKELLAMQVEYWVYDARNKKVVGELGVVVDRVKVELDDSGRGRGRLLVRFKLGDLFRELASKSDFWGRLPLKEVVRLTSRYAIALHRFLSSYEAIEGRREVTVDVERLRRLMGMGSKRYAEFKSFNRWVLQRAVADINGRLDWELECRQIRRNRRVARICFTWKGSGNGVEERAERSGEAAVGFPDDGEIEGTVWGRIARAEGGGVDANHIGRRWAAWVRRKNTEKASKGEKDRLSVNDERRFTSFCKRFAGDDVSGEAAAGGNDALEVGEHSPFELGLEFPETPILRAYRYWKNLVEEYGGGTDADHVGYEFQRYCERCGISLAAPDIRDRFVVFCKKRVWHENWQRKSDEEALALTGSRSDDLSGGGS